MRDEEHLQKVKEYIDAFAAAMELDDLSGFLNEVQNFYDEEYFQWLYERANRVKLLENCVFELMKSFKAHDDELKRQKEYTNRLKEKVANETGIDWGKIDNDWAVS